MHTLYRLVSDHGIAEFLTLITFGLLCLGYLSFVWGNSKQRNTRLTTWHYSQIYFFGVLVFLTGVIILGKLIVPKNVDALLQLLHIEDVLRYASQKYQAFLQGILRLFM